MKYLKYIPLLLAIPLIAYALVVFLPVIFMLWIKLGMEDFDPDVVRCDGGEGMTPHSPTDKKFLRSDRSLVHGIHEKERG